MPINENLGEASIYIRAKLDKLKTDLNKATAASTTAAKTLRDRFSSAFGGVANAARTAVVAITAALYSLNRLANAVDDVAKAAKRMGLSVEEFQQLKLAADLAGAEVSQLETAMVQFTRKISEAETGSQRAVDAFLAIEQAAGGGIDLSNRQEAFLKVLDTLAKIPDETVRAKLALELLGARSAASLLPLLENLSETREQARELGSTISSDTAKKFEEFKDSLTILTNNTMVAFAEGSADIVVTLTEWAKWAAAAAKSSSELSTSTNTLTDAILAGSSAFGVFGRVIAELNKQKINETTEALKGFEPYTGIFGAMGQAISYVVSGLGEIKAHDGEETTITVNTVTKTNGVEDTQSTSVPSVSEQLAAAREKAKALADAQEKTLAKQREKELNESVRLSVRDSFATGIKEALAGGDLKDVLSNFFDGVFNAISDRFAQSIADSVMGRPGDGGGGLFGNLFGGGGGLFDSIGSLFGGKAMGGNVAPNQPYLVGERGPELFIPQNRGLISPNSAGSGGNITIVMNNNFEGVNSVNRQELARAGQIIEQRVLSSVTRNARSGGSFSKNLRGA